MITEFVEYLNSLGMGEQFISRIRELYDECQSLTAASIEEVFVSEQTVGNERQYRG